MYKLYSKVKYLKISNVVFFIFLLLGVYTYASDKNSIEFQHFWVSSGEKKALSLLEKKFRSVNGEWRDSPSKNYEIMKRDFIQRLTAGLPSSALWLDGKDINLFSSLGLLRNMSDIYKEEKWSKNIYDFAVEKTKTNNVVYALPITIHNENWAWYNVELYRKLGLRIPHTWDEFLKQAVIIKKAGYIPLSISEDAWNVRLLFSTILAGVGGKILYNRLYINEDLGVFEDPKMQRVLSIFAQLRAFKSLPGQAKTWDEATKMLIRGEAAMQIMGDWVLGDLLEPGIGFESKFICASVPEAEEIFIAAIDFIAFPKVQSKIEKKGQSLLASLIVDKDFQIEFSNLKGSIPTRNDIDGSQLQSCSAKSLVNLTTKEKRLLSPRMTMDEYLRSSLQKILDVFWNNNDMTIKQITEQFKKLSHLKKDSH